MILGTMNKYKDQLFLTLQDILNDIRHLKKFQDIKDLKEELEIIFKRYDWALERLIADDEGDKHAN